jgi:hypothetical protein
MIFLYALPAAPPPPQPVSQPVEKPAAMAAPRSFTPPGLDAARAAVRAQTQNGGGRVLSTESIDGNYRIKLLKDGEVRIHVISPNPK